MLELLKQYHGCKSCLTSIIQKQEHALSQQASYMGKDNLQRIIANVSLKAVFMHATLFQENEQKAAEMG